MSKLLYIKANPKPEGQSRTFKISDSFIEKYKGTHPDDEIITLDLYKEDIYFLTEEDLSVVFGPKTEGSRKHPVLRYTYQFAEADKYVIAAPMWNLSIPAILKAYIDYICVTGITFKYTESGSVGLLQGKKAVHITARGGNYSEGAGTVWEMDDRYLRIIFGFMGVTDFTTIHADELDVQGKDVDAIVENAIKEAEEKTKNF